MMYPDPGLRDHLASLCILKLQRASTGRTHSLLRQVQLTCMLHRMRMQSFLQVASSSSLPSSSSDLSQADITGSFPFSTSFSQSAFSFENEYAHFAQDSGAPDFQWDQDSMDSSLASSLSLDLLLSMGASQNAADSAAAASVSAAAASMMDTDQQGLFNLGQLGSMSFGSFSEDYPQGVPVVAAADACVSSSCPPPIPSPSALPSLSSPALAGSQCSPMIEVASALLPPTAASSSSSLLIPSSLPLAASSNPQPSYYELLMSAGQTEPLSQLLSTNAASISSPTFLVASKGDEALSNTPMADKIDISSGHANDTPSTYNLAAFPLSAGSSQRTVPLTTREIMDALSGNFPSQATPTSIEPDQNLVPAATASESVEPHRQQGATVVLQREDLRSHAPSSEMTEQMETSESLSEEAVPELEEDRRTPERDQRSSSTDVGGVDDDPASMDVDEDLSLGRMTLRSPPVSPRKRPAAGPKRALSSRKMYSKNMKDGRSKSSIRYPGGPSSRPRRSRKFEETDADLAELVRRNKRRRLSEDSSSDSGPESAPSSPKTPPSNHDGHDHPLLPHRDKSNKDGPHHLQPLSDLNLNLDLSLLPGTDSSIGQLKGALHHHHPMAAMNVDVEGVMNLNHMEDDDGAEAGILSTSVHTRYPTKRQSARLLNRISAQHDHHKYRA
ncbi:hypothetical protein EMPS_04926 [Entomortierella parvispora]|uniref:Uncharacterized protein n=1 Tax=Entomortierella parvispora TaxID=205924 RepID=A0A9P3H9X9_9FUNG|nr:hypothetical protein EMPS_04926 [Entomortierella parvispora]